jgi:hypothetical protein
VAVEKLHFRQNSENLGDTKCPGKPGTSFVGLSIAKFFSQFSVNEFFNSHRQLHQLSLVGLIVGEIAIFRQPSWSSRKNLTAGRIKILGSPAPESEDEITVICQR